MCIIKPRASKSLMESFHLPAFPDVGPRFRADLPCSLGAGHTLIYHPAFDLARLAMRGIEKDAPCYVDLHRVAQSAFIAAAAVLVDNIEYLFPRIAVFRPGRDLDYHVH